MKRIGKIIALSIAVGFILLMTFVAVGVLVLQDKGKVNYEDYDRNVIVEKQEELFKEVFQSYKPVWKFDSIRANTDSINTIYPSAPDSLIYCRQYYEDGKLAAEGWMLYDWSREIDYTDTLMSTKKS